MSSPDTNLPYDEDTGAYYDPDTDTYYRDSEGTDPLINEDDW